MPARPPVPGVIRTALHWQVGLDNAAETISYWAYTGPAPTGLQLIAMATEFNALQVAEWPIYLSPGVIYLGIDIADLSSLLGEAGGAGAAVVGTRATTPNAADVCALLNYTIARHYRGGKPRSYLPWLTNEDRSDENHWTSGAVTDVETGWSTVQAAMAAAAPSAAIAVSGQVNVSYLGPPNAYKGVAPGRITTHSTPRAAPIVDLLPSFRCNPILGSQRRRNLHPR